MTRKFTILIAAIAMLFTFGGVQDAQAQCTDGYNNNVVCADALDYPSNGFGSGNADADDDDDDNDSPAAATGATATGATATTGSTGGNAIAFTGSESTVLGYVGAGLIGFGAVALVAARRKETSDLD